MQQVSNNFNDLAEAGRVRPIGYQFRAAFDKIFDPNTTFFTLDSSVLDGPDILALGTGDVIQASSQYNYVNYTDRVVQVEWQREEDIPYSVTTAIADIRLDNYDEFFTFFGDALTENFFDNFNEPLDFTRKWYDWAGTQLVQDNGRIEITSRATAGFSGIHTIYRFNMTGSFVQTELVDAGNQALEDWSAYPVSIENNANNSVQIFVNENNLFAAKTIGGTFSVVDQIAYNDAVHNFLRIREDNGTFYYDYSTDGDSWTNFADTPTTGIDVTKLRLDIFAGTTSDTATITNAVFDNFNCNADGTPVNDEIVSPIAGDVLPRRPVRLLAGFGNEVIPQFVGLTTQSAQVNSDRTATIHMEDFLSFIFNKPLEQSVILINKRTDEILAELFDLAGIASSQYNLDEGFNLVRFTYFEVGKKLGNAMRELMQAEMGSLYLDELGVIQFRNRLRNDTSPVMTFDESNIVEYRTSDETKIINQVFIRSDVREVQPTQPVYSSETAVELMTGSNEIFFNFDDPVTSLEDIEQYVANSNEFGDGTDVTSDVSVSNTELFATAVKVTFNNTSGSTAYLTELYLYGTPAPVVKRIDMRLQDDDSIATFEEQPIEIENDFVQSEDGANSLGLSLLNYYKDFNNTIEITVIGNFALQLGDNITISLKGKPRNYTITKLLNTIEAGRYRQIITAKIFNIPNFFILDESLLNSGDVLAP